MRRKRQRVFKPKGSPTKLVADIKSRVGAFMDSKAIPGAGGKEKDKDRAELEVTGNTMITELQLVIYDIYIKDS